MASHRLFLVLFFSFLSASSQALPGLCDRVMNALAEGDLTYARENGRRPLEAQTMADLRMDEVLLPILDRTRTEPGRRRMRSLMERPFRNADDLRLRQDAAREISEKPELRKALTRSLRRLQRAADARTLPHLTEDKALFGRKDQARYGATKAAGYGGPTAALIYTLPLGIAPLTYLPGLGAMIAQEPATWGKRSQLRRYGTVLREAQALSEALAAAESPVLREIGQQLAVAARSREEGGIADTVALLNEVRHPLMTLVPDVLYGHSAYRLHPHSEAVNRDRAQIAQVLSALGDLDVLTAFGEMAGKPGGEYVFPRPLDRDAPFVRIEQGHHPYVFHQTPRVSVPNDLTLGKVSPEDAANPYFLVVTGANAEGKSSYLNMVALQSVMAQMGAPVPAKAMEFTPIEPITYRKPTDSMVEGKSSFQAESARLGEIMSRVKRGERLLVVLDQMLEGTNSAQRVAAQTAIIRYLASRGHLGMLATHDHELTEAAEVTRGVGNVHMSRYRLRPGPSAEGNAFEVMEGEKLPREIIEDARRIYRAHQAGIPFRDAAGGEGPAALE